MKQCRVCLKNKNRADFSVNNATTDGLQSKCKECDNEYQRTRRRKPSNIKQRKEYSKKYREDRKDSFEWRIQQLVHAAKARARAKGRDFAITLDDVLGLYPEDGCCPVFGFEMVFGDSNDRECSPSIDRIDSELGYTSDNIQILSWKANRMKADFTLNELKALVAFMED